MEDNLSKYLRLFGSILLLFLGFIAALILFMLAVRLLFGVLSYLPWLNYIYVIFILSVPVVLFTTVYIIFFRRTRSHPSIPVRWISYILFAAAIAAWILFYILDLISFAKNPDPGIGSYQSFNLLFLFLNIACIFFTGVLQALTTEKEKDWRERNDFT